MRSWHGLVRIWKEPGATQQYYPLTHSAFWLEHKLWGDAVLPYHFVNISLHLGSALLLFVLLRRLSLDGAWLAAALFALHPVHVESVAWISELKNTLSTFLALASALFCLRFYDDRRTSSYVVALVLFLLGLFSKSVIATLPAALLVVLWWKNGAIRWKRDLLPLLPFVCAGIGAGLVTMWMEANQIGAKGSDFDFSFIARCLIAGRAICFYFGKLLLPLDLTFIYPRWHIDTNAWWQYIFPAAFIIAVGAAYLMRQRWRGPLAAVLLFADLLFPALGFVNVFPFIYSFVADHFQYLASIAVFSAIAFLITRMPQRLSYAVGLALSLTLAALTWQQAHAYTDAETLYRTTIARNPDCWMAYNNLANILARAGRNDDTIPYYREAIRLRPTYLEAHYNLSNALLRRGEVDEAIMQGEAAVSIKASSVEANNNLANALRQKGRFADAIRHYDVALTAEPDNLATKNNLAWLLATCSDHSLRDVPRALSLAREANEQSGGSNPIILHTLSAAYAQSGNFREARTVAQRALELARAHGNVEVTQLLQKEIAQLDDLLR